MAEINAINGINSSFSPSKNINKIQDKTFGDRLRNAMKEVNKEQVGSNMDAEGVVKETVGIHEGMLSLQEADISMRYFLQVRSKIMESYKEIMRMPV